MKEYLHHNQQALFSSYSLFSQTSQPACPLFLFSNHSFPSLNHSPSYFKMLPPSRLCALIPAFLLLAQEAAGSPCGPGMKAAATAGKAVYFINNDQSNGVVALPIKSDGTVSKGTVTLTGGCGSVGVNAEGKPATPDALISQSSLTIAGKVS